MREPFDLLRVLITVAESANFREAAQKLKITQPGVTLKLRELESQQPLPIFSLEGKRKILTPFGRSLYQVAKKNAGQLERGIEELYRTYASPELLSVRIGGRVEVLDYIAPYLDFPGRIEFVGLSGSDAIAQIQRHTIDIAISYILPDSADLIAKKLFKSKAHFCIHSKLLKRKKPTLDLVKNRDFLRNTPCISFHREGHLIADWASHNGVEFSQLKVKYVAEDWRLVQSAVDRGEGFAILPFYVKSYSPEVERIEIPSTSVKELDYFAIYEPGLKKVDAFKRLLSFNRL